MNKSLANQIHDTIRSEIINCTLKPGEQIAQPQLAKKYKVGLTPVREALQRLAQEGFVQALPRFGYIVTPVTISDLTEIYELRSILEPAAVRLAALRGSDEKIKQIAEASSTIKGNAEFHLLIADATGNRFLAESLARIFNRLTRVFHYVIDVKDYADEMRDAHIALARAICSRDPDEAERLIRAEIALSQQRVMQAMIPNSDSSKSTILSQAIHITPPTS